MLWYGKYLFISSQSIIFDQAKSVLSADDTARRSQVNVFSVCDRKGGYIFLKFYVRRKDFFFSSYKAKVITELKDFCVNLLENLMTLQINICVPTDC